MSKLSEKYINKNNMELMLDHYVVVVNSGKFHWLKHNSVAYVESIVGKNPAMVYLLGISKETNNIIPQTVYLEDIRFPGSRLPTKLLRAEVGEQVTNLTVARLTESEEFPHG